jgi:dTMP kinase
MDKRGKFIVIDGMDGSGKGTQLALLRSALKEFPVHYTREPGGNGSDTAEFLRKVILEPDSFAISPTPLCDFFLFFGSRAQHVEEVVEPKREVGMHVISDRYDSSTWAFQICGEDRAELKELFRSVRHGLSTAFQPDLYIFLDLPAEVAFERRKKDAPRTKPGSILSRSNIISGCETASDPFMSSCRIVPTR